MFTRCQQYSSNRIYTSNHWYHRIADFEYGSSLNFTAELEKSIIEHTRIYTTNVTKLKQLKNKIKLTQNERHHILLKYIISNMKKEKIRVNDVNQVRSQQF